MRGLAIPMHICSEGPLFAGGLRDHSLRSIFAFTLDQQEHVAFATMQSTFIATLAVLCLLDISNASPAYRVEVRQVLPRQSNDTAKAVLAAAQAVDAAVTSLLPNGNASMTLFQDSNKFATAPAPASGAPTSGCVLVTEQASTFTEIDTYALVPTPSTTTLLATFSAGLACTCAGDIIAGVVSSYNPEGTMYLLCATAGHTPADTATDAVSTSNPQASAKPGDPLNPDWADVSCSLPELQNVGGSTNPAASWNVSGTRAAWNAMTLSYGIDRLTTYLSFCNYLVNFFHGPAVTNCDVVGQGSCDGQVNCGTHLAPNGNVNSPAAYMIIASMEGLHQMLEAINTGITAAAATMSVEAFTKAFSPM